jgi:hypothetical protein
VEWTEGERGRDTYTSFDQEDYEYEYCDEPISPFMPSQAHVEWERKLHLDYAEPALITRADFEGEHGVLEGPVQSVPNWDEFQEEEPDEWLPFPSSPTREATKTEMDEWWERYGKSKEIDMKMLMGDAQSSVPENKMDLLPDIEDLPFPPPIGDLVSGLPRIQIQFEKDHAVELKSLPSEIALNVQQSVAILEDVGLPQSYVDLIESHLDDSLMDNHERQIFTDTPPSDDFKGKVGNLVYDTATIGAEMSGKLREFVLMLNITCMIDLIVQSLLDLPNARCVELLHSCGVVCGNVSKTLMIQLFRSAARFMRPGVLRNLCLMLMIMRFPTNASASRYEHCQDVIDNDQMAPRFVDSCREFIFCVDQFAPLGMRSVCEGSYGLFANAFWNGTVENPLVAHASNIFHGAFRVTANVFITFNRGTDLVTVMYLGSATVVAASIILSYFYTFYIFAKLFRRLFKYFHFQYVAMRLRWFAQVKFDMIKPIEILAWRGADSHGFTFDSNIGPIRLSAKQVEAILHNPAKKSEFESPKPNSATYPVSRWPAGACWLLRMDGSDLCDNGGCVRANLGGDDYLVTTTHQLRECGDTVYLQSEQGARSYYTINREKQIWFDCLELIAISVPAKHWPPGVKRIDPVPTDPANRDNLTGVFYGMIKGQLHFSTGRIERPSAFKAGHRATTYPGWCGWPVFVGTQWQFLHYLGDSPLNGAVNSGALLSAVSKVLLARKHESIDWTTADLLDNIRKHSGDSERLGRSTANTGTEIIHIFSDPVSGKTWALDQADYRNLQVELHNGAYLKESREQSYERMNTDQYQEQADKEYDEIYKEDRSSTKSEDADYRESKEEREKREEEELEERALLDDKVAVAIGLQAPKEKTIVPSPAAEKKFKCLCGNTDMKHECGHKIDVSAHSEEDIARLRKFIIERPPTIPEAGRDEEEPKKEDAKTLESAEKKYVKCHHCEQMLPVGPANKKERVAHSILMKHPKGVPPVSKPQAPESKRLENADVKSDFQKPPQVTPPVVAEKKAKTQPKLERFRMTEEYEKLIWRERETKGGLHLVADLPDEKMAWRHTDRPKVLWILPRHSSQAISLAPSLSSLKKENPSITPRAAGSPNQGPQ